MTAPEPLTAEQVARFHSDGVLVVPDFYDLTEEILPVQRSIHQVIGQVMKRHGITDSRPPFTPAGFDSGYQTLIALDRAHGGEVYDAIKQIPAFIRLLASSKHESIFRQLRHDSIPAIAAAGYGIRIDNPNEDRYRAAWHQEYPAQLRSLDGLVFWSPLLPISDDIGPIRFCLGSHSGGVVPVITATQEREAGAYALRLKDEASLIQRYAHTAPLTAPGDLVVVDFLTLHASGFNRSHRSRWSMQFRYFNFDDPVGLSHGWMGSFAAGIDFRVIHPELCAD